MNTGDSLVALQYSVRSRRRCSQSSDTTPPSSDVGKLHHSSHIQQEFAQDNSTTGTTPGTCVGGDLLLQYLETMFACSMSKVCAETLFSSFRHVLCRVFNHIFKVGLHAACTQCHRNGLFLLHEVWRVLGAFDMSIESKGAKCI